MCVAILAMKVPAAVWLLVMKVPAAVCECVTTMKIEYLMLSKMFAKF